MSLKKRFILFLLIYLLAYAISFLLFAMVNKISFIPILNNTIIITAILGFISVQIFVFIKCVKSDLKIYLKILLTIIIIILALIWTYFLLLASIFTVKNDNPFIYKAQKYYYLDVGWFDPEYEIYRKNFILMDKLSGNEIKNIFIDIYEIEDDRARTIIEDIIFPENKYKSYKIEDNQAKEVEPDGGQDLLDKFLVEDSIRIKDSNFALVEVDHAGARSRWFFVKIEGDKMKFISELEDSSPDAEGKVKGGNIYLKFKDIHENTSEYKSTDDGLTWILIK